MNFWIYSVLRSILFGIRLFWIYSALRIERIGLKQNIRPNLRKIDYEFFVRTDCVT